MSRSKFFALTPFASLFAMLVYVFALFALGDPRAQDLKIDKSEMHVFESIWMAATMIGILIVWLRSVWRSFVAQHTGWFLAVLLFWPVTAFYVWKKE